MAGFSQIETNKQYTITKSVCQNLYAIWKYMHKYIIHFQTELDEQI